jgi:beta-galactosidase
LYIPASILYSGQQPSKIWLLELDQNPCDYPETCFVTFDTTPIINGPVKPLTKQRSQILKHSDPWVSKYITDDSSWNIKDDTINSILSRAFESFHRKVV